MPFVCKLDLKALQRLTNQLGFACKWMPDVARLRDCNATRQRGLEVNMQALHMLQKHASLQSVVHTNTDIESLQTLQSVTKVLAKLIYKLYSSREGPVRHVPGPGETSNSVRQWKSSIRCVRNVDVWRSGVSKIIEMVQGIV